MYCPSCDKSYGAVHSRCPECHSWLKVSAPANHRSKSAKAASASGAAGAVSTLDKEPSWPEQSRSASPPAWGGSSSESWSDALPTSSAPQEPAPATKAQGGWSGGGGWGDESSSEWSGVTKMPSAGPMSPASSGGWLGGEDASSSGGSEWSAPKPVSKSPVSPAPTGGGWLGGQDNDEQDDGWGGSSVSSKVSSGSLGASPGASQTGGGASPARDDWNASSSGGGWLGDSDDPPMGGARADASGSSAGWLSGGARETHTESHDGWLSEESPSKAPSMTEMVDRAIGVEEADDFVDESWVDIDDGDFDPIAEPEYSSPTPEVGGVFLKMLLVAALVLVVGGGLMFIGKEEKTPEQIKAEERVKELEFARGSVEAGKKYLKDGTPLLAIGPLTAAVTSLKTSGAPVEEIFAARAELARALMKTQDYEKAHEQWSGLVKAPESYRKEALSGRDESSRLLREQAAAELADAANYIQMGESSSVLQAGEKALKIFEKHGGTASQKGKALGVIGRGYINNKEYGKAKDYLHKAKSLNPGGGYEADFQLISSRTAPTDYYSGGNAGSSYVPPAPVAQPAAAPMRASIDSDKGYVKSTGTVVRRAPRQASVAPVAPQAVQQQQRVAQPAAAPRRAPASNSSGGRKGSKGVLPGYDSK